MSNTAGFRDCGAVVFQGADVLIGYNLPDEKKIVTVGLCKASLDALAEVGRCILSVGCRGYPRNIERRLLVEIAARIRAGVDGDATFHSLIALASLHTLLEPAILDLARTGNAVDVAIRDGRKPACSIAPQPKIDFKRAFDELTTRISADWDAPSVERPDELLIKIHVERWNQFVSVPHRKIDKRIKRAEQAVAGDPAADCEPLLGQIACALVSLYHKALMGDMPDMPASTLDWRDMRRQIAGAVCWLLRERGLLGAALSGSDKCIAVLAFEPDAPMSFTLALEPVASD